ncbi:I4E1B [Hepatospora eriocheir]|uniref:I4E1B n=1 Tax=Hepatospora eriocheir TaxID=1081669 RepID=A0A1X0QBW6_9MICR|nr:I4E1B [Hepatospora eriocheir]
MSETYIEKFNINEELLNTMMEEQTKTWNFLQMSSTEEKLKSYADNFSMVNKIQTAPELLYVIDALEKETLSELDDLFFFKEGYLPLAENPNNLGGGRIIFEVSKSTDLSEFFFKSLCLCFSEVFDGLTGVAYNDKGKDHRVVLWFNDIEDYDMILSGWKELNNCPFGNFNLRIHRKYSQFFTKGYNVKKSFQNKRHHY